MILPIPDFAFWMHFKVSEFMAAFPTTEDGKLQMIFLLYKSSAQKGKRAGFKPARQKLNLQHIKISGV